MEQSGFQWFLTAMKKYTIFDGRARRKEYWYFVLFSNLVTVPVAIYTEINTDFELANLIVSLVFMLPNFAVSVRRMHDVGKSGWYIIIPFYNLYLFAMDSQVGDNEYGPNPKNQELSIEDHLID